MELNELVDLHDDIFSDIDFHKCSTREIIDLLKQEVLIKGSLIELVERLYKIVEEQKKRIE